MDCYFKVTVSINGQSKEAFVSVAEATILSLLYEVEQGLYKQGVLEEFISSETRQAMDDLMDTVYLYDRLDPGKKQKRTYGSILIERGILGAMPEQAMFPRFDAEDNYKLTDKYTAPGSHGHWSVYALSNIPDNKLPDDGSIQIRTIFNGDGISNSPNNVIAGWMARERVPLVMITTTRAPIDVKGGMLGIEYLENNKVRKNILELADAKTNDKEHPGQAELFKNMGISKTDKRFVKDSAQLFNTNTVVLNDTVLQPFLKGLREALDIKEYNRVISPKMMMKSVVQKDGREYVQLEGAMGSSVLSLAGFLSATDNPQVIALCKKHGIDRSKFLRIVNIDVKNRTDFFAPIKFPIDYWLQFFSDHFIVDTTTWKLKNLRPGHVPALDTPDQDKDEFYSNVLNLFNLFGDNGMLSSGNPVMTSTIGLDFLKIRGKVKIAGSVLRGNIALIYQGDDIADLTQGKIRKQLISDNIARLDNGKLLLENVVIVINKDGEAKAVKVQNREEIDKATNTLISDKAASSGMSQKELKDIYDAQRQGRWKELQDNQLRLKEAFLASYADTWESKVMKEYPGISFVFNGNDPNIQRIVFTPDMAGVFNITPRDKKTGKPTGHFKEFYEKSDNSTAGVRAFYDPLHSNNPNVMYNEAFLAILVQAEAEFLKAIHSRLVFHIPDKDSVGFDDFIKQLRRDIPAEDITIIEEIYGMALEDIIAFLKHNIVKLVGGEVRAHTARFVELESRILAANNITVLTAENYSDSVPIYMFSFLTYLLGASGATNNTPSHSSNYIFGRKALAPDGSQLLPDLYERYREIIDDIIENRIYGVNSQPYEIKISSAHDKHIMNTLSYDRMAGLYASILNITPEEVALINSAADNGHRIVLNCLNGSTWKTLSVLLDRLGIKKEVFGLVMEDEDPYFNIGYIVTKSDKGIYGIDHLGVDTTMEMVARTIPYHSFLTNYPAGTRQYELDPDSDRFVVKQVLENNEENIRLIKEYGIDFYELGNNKILIAPSPNKVFLSLDIADYERMVEAGTWQQFHSLYLITYVSSKAWSEFADAADGLIRVMHRVGFKNLNDVQRVVQLWYDKKLPFDVIKDSNSFIKQITDEAIVFYDQLGREITISRDKRVRIHSKQEESGGRVAGMNRPSFNLLGQSTLAMPEKSAADSLLSELAYSSKLFLHDKENYSFLKSNDRAFKKFGLRSKIDTRLDILHGDQGAIAKMSFKDKEAALSGALLNKTNFNNFFFSVANAVKQKNITRDKAVEILTSVLPKYADTWYCLDDITLAEEELSGTRTRPEGAPLIFKSKDGKVPLVTEFDFRPSGTDPLKSKIYYDAETAPDKNDIKEYFEALTKYNLYDVLNYYSIEPVIKMPEGVSDIGLKSLVLGQGPKPAASGMLADPAGLAEDGFVFEEWSETPAILATGMYANLKNVSEGISADETMMLNPMLKRIKERLLEEGGFTESDFNIRIRVVYPAYKSAVYDRVRDIIIIDRRCFYNYDFLYFKIKHELTDRNMPDVDIIGKEFRESPGLRELFTLITVNIAGFMELRKSEPKRAREMLNFCRSVGHYKKGILKCYEKIMRDVSLNDPFDLTEDVFRLVESDEEKVYFPNMRNAVRRLAKINKEGKIDYTATARDIRSELVRLNNRYIELSILKDALTFRPITDFSDNTPPSLKPFMPYSEYVDYKLDNDCIFLRIKLVNSLGAERFAYVYIGLKDNWELKLGRYGRIYGLSYHKWQNLNPRIFKFKDIKGQEERDAEWNKLISMPIAELRDILNKDSNRDYADSFFERLSDSLKIKGDISKKTWLLVKNEVGRKKGPAEYYLIRGLIWKHIDRVFPKFFLGEVNLQDMPLADVPAWVITDYADMAPRLLSWLNPRKKQTTLNMYNYSKPISLSGILDLLRQQKALAAASSKPNTQPVYRVNLTLFDDINPSAYDLRKGEKTQSILGTAA